MCVHVCLTFSEIEHLHICSPEAETEPSLLNSSIRLEEFTFRHNYRDKTQGMRGETKLTLFFLGLERKIHVDEGVFLRDDRAEVDHRERFKRVNAPDYLTKPTACVCLCLFFDRLCCRSSTELCFHPRLSYRKVFLASRLDCSARVRAVMAHNVVCCFISGLISQTAFELH